MQRKGQFISIEGGEGSGKSTQIALLKAAFARSGLPALFTREPGGCASAEAVRALLVTGEADRWLAESEALLVMAARFEHVQRVIEPALSKGEWVISDRFFDSTRVYQGLGRGLGDAWLSQLHHMVLGNIMPNLTFYLDIAPEIGLARTQTRSGSEHRFESMALSFHEQVRSGFQAIAKAEVQRVVQLDATVSAQTLHQCILDCLNARFDLQLTPEDSR